MPQVAEKDLTLGLEFFLYFIREGAQASIIEETNLKEDPHELNCELNVGENLVEGGGNHLENWVYEIFFLLFVGIFLLGGVDLCFENPI